MALAAVSCRGREGVGILNKRLLQPCVQIIGEMGRVARDRQNVGGPDLRAVGQAAGHPSQGAFDLG